MKSIKKLIIALSVFFTVTISAHAQLSLGPIWKLNYEVGFPMGDFNSKFISSPGWRGFSVKANWFPTDSHNFSLGAVAGFNGFYQKDERDTYYYENKALTGTRMKYAYTVPLLATAQYIFADNEGFNPYFSIGMGPYWLQQEDQIGRYLFDENAWKFGLNPEVGVMFPFNIDMGFVASVGYNSIFYSTNGIDNLGYLSVSVGLYFN